jgi:hypothetical protein
MNKATPDKDRKVVHKEIQVHSALVHENIIRMKDALILEDNGSSKFIPGAYLLLEMAHGGDLFDKIGKHGRGFMNMSPISLGDSSRRWSQ